MDVQLQEIFEYLRENLKIRIKDRILGFPQEGDYTTQFTITLSLKNPTTGEQEDVDFIDFEIPGTE